MPPNFEALSLIAEIAIGIVGFSAILIGLNRTSHEFKPPDVFRIQMLTYSSFGAVFCSLMPFAVFPTEGDFSTSWLLIGAMLSVYSALGLWMFPRRMLALKKGYPDLFPMKLVILQMGIIVTSFVIAVLILLDLIEHKANFYTGTLILLLVHSSTAFVRTMFYRVD